MGVTLSSYIGLQVTYITYSDDNLDCFLQMKGLTKNSVEFPYSSVKQFLLIYMDDLLVFTDETQQNASNIHLLAVEFVLYCSKRMGLKFVMNKTIFMAKNFKFLGYEFRDSANSIPGARRNNFKNMRSPRSQAETISRLASISYFEETLPQLRKLAAPLFEMVKSEKFKWGPVENASWEAIKLLISRNSKIAHWIRQNHFSSQLIVAK